MIQELVLNKLQDILGENYMCYLATTFSRTYTNPYKETIDTQAFDKNKEIVPVILNILPAQFGNVDFLSLNTNYTLTFFAPIDNIKMDKFGTPIEDVAINVYEDIDKLKSELHNKEIDFGDTIKGRMSFSLATPAPVIHDTGTYRRMEVNVSGLINLTDKGFFAGERKLELKINGDYTEVKDFYNREISNDRNGVQVQKIGDAHPETIGIINANTVTFTVDATDDITDNLNKFLQKIASGETLTDKVVGVRITRGADTVEYNAVISVSIVALSGANGVEQIKVSLARQKE